LVIVHESSRNRPHVDTMALDARVECHHTGRVSFTESQEQILEATMQVIVRDGLDAASMRAVAEEADVSLGLLSYHFDAKENLIVSAFKLGADRLIEFTAEQIEAAGPDPIDRVRAAVRSFFDAEFVSSEYLALWFAIWGVSRTNHEVAELERALHDRYNKIIGATIQAADPDLNATRVGERITDLAALQNGLWLNWTRFEDRDALERGLARCEAIALGFAS